jgi:hypothetical protein
MDNFGSDFLSQTLQNLGLDSGSAAAKTVGQAVGQIKNSSSAPVAAATPSVFSIPDTIFGMDKKTALLVGAAVALVVILAVRRK